MRTATYFHCNLKPVSRSAGKAVVASAAYRTGLNLYDERYGTHRDFSEKKDVVTWFNFAPDGASDWAHDPERLWNAVEAKENRKNSQLAFDVTGALPNELDDAHRENIARNFTHWLKEEYGVAGTAALHSGGSRGNGLNDHLHVLFCTRELDESGWAKNKLRDFNCAKGQSNPEIDKVREVFAGFINDELADTGSETRVTHESYRARGIDIEGTKHLGPKASAMENSGEETDRGSINRQILEARLVWQAETAAEITDRELAARFGDDFADTLKEAQAGEPVPQIEEHAKQDARPLTPDMEASAKADILPQPRGWRERVRSLFEYALDFIRDESSGRRQEPSPEQQVEAQPGETPEPQQHEQHGWLWRTAKAGVHALHGWREHNCSGAQS